MSECFYVVKDFASRGFPGRTRADVLRVRVAIRARLWFLPRKKLRFTPSGKATLGRVFYVHVLRSEKDDVFYIGFSTDLKRRLSEQRRGASFATKSRGLWKLIYYEAYTEREDAEGREEFLKSGAGRRFLRAQLRHCFTRFPARLRL